MLIRLFNLCGSRTHALNKKCVQSFPVTFVANMFLADRCLVIYALDLCPRFMQRHKCNMCIIVVRFLPNLDCVDTVQYTVPA